MNIYDVRRVCAFEIPERFRRARKIAQPIVTSRTEVSRATLERAHRRERWQRIAVASVKQCGRALLPPILEPLEAEMLPQAISARQLPVPAFMLVEPSASAHASARSRGSSRARCRR